MVTLPVTLPLASALSVASVTGSECRMAVTSLDGFHSDESTATVPPLATLLGDTVTRPGTVVVVEPALVVVVDPALVVTVVPEPPVVTVVPVPPVVVVTWSAVLQWVTLPAASVASNDQVIVWLAASAASV